MVEEADYVVRVTLTTGVAFAPMKRDTPITRGDAVANAVSSMPDGFWEQLDAAGWTVEAVAERVA